MFYEKSNEKVLDDKLFNLPTSEFRGAPFWAWNCKLEKEELLWQIDRLKEMGYGGFHMHVRSGMNTEYLSDEYMDLISACVQKAKKLGMKAYLYDEDKWASGFAGGKVTKNKNFRQRMLKLAFEKIPEEKLNEVLGTCKAELLTAFDLVLDGDGYIKEYSVLEGKPKGKALYIYSCIAGNDDWFNLQSYVDVMNKKAIDKFVEVTHEKFYEKVGDDFSSTVPSIFTDEPQYAQKQIVKTVDSKDVVSIPWTADFDKRFKALKGYSIEKKLPEIFYEVKPVNKTRYDYFDVLTELFTNCFSKNIGDWCKGHGIELTGHLMCEESLGLQSSYVGECMRHYKYFGIPGIDLLCNRTEFTTAKQCQSIVHQYGKRGMLSELYGVTDWDFDFRGHKFQGDWQAALGVTLRVPHLSWVSMKGSAKRDYPACFNYQSSWYKEYGYVEDHFARLNTVLTRGKPVVKVAVVHPIESFWLYHGVNSMTSGIREQLEKRFSDIIDWLLYGTIDFDFISESDLVVNKVETGKTFTVGEMTYDAVILPNNKTLRKTTLDYLYDYENKGGKLVVMDGAPEFIDAVPSTEGKKLLDKAVVIPFDREELFNVLKDERLVSVKNADGNSSNNLIYAMREDGEFKWLFVAHGKDYAIEHDTSKDVPKDQKVKIYIKGEYTPTLYDTVSGEVKQLGFYYENGNTVIDRRIYASDSLLIKLSAKSKPVEYVDRGGFYEQKSILDKGERIFTTVDYEREEENALILDTCNFRYDDGEWQGYENVIKMTEKAKKYFGYPSDRCQPYISPAKKPAHKITVKYTFYSDKERTGLYFASEDATTSKILFNGRVLKAEPVGYYVDKSVIKLPLPKVKKGENTLQITMPFGARDFFEPVYVLGEFGVKVQGPVCTLIDPEKQIGFGSIVDQGMPFYGGNIFYKTTFTAKETGKYKIVANFYRGAMIKVFVDGKEQGKIVYAPYELEVNLNKGEHKITYELFGNRNNTFGSIHNTNEKWRYVSPWHWLSEGTEFSYGYVMLKPMGIMQSPIVVKL